MGRFSKGDDEAAAASRCEGVSVEDVLAVLRQVEDPDLRRDIVSLGFVKNVLIEDGRVRFDVELTTPACPVKEDLRLRCEQVVRSLDGVSDVTVNMTAAVRSSLARVGEGMAQVKNVIAVASGKGGVGKSTMAVNLALGLASSGAEVGLLDADLYGPSIPTMLGVHEQPHVTHDQRVIPVGKHGLKLMSMGFVAGGDAPVILRGPMVTNVLRQFLAQVDWGELDYLVIDLPPGTGDTQLTLTQSASLSGALIVTTPQEVSLIDARKAIGMFAKVNVPILGLVENMSYFECGHCGERTNIFGTDGARLAAERLGVPFLGGLPIDPRLVETCDRGEPFLERHPESPTAAALLGVAGAVARALSIRSMQCPGDDAQPGGSVDPAMRHQARRVEPLGDGGLRITWADGFQSDYAAAYLRAQCLCAQCVDELSGERRVNQGDIDPQVRAESVKPVGNYAISIVWSDGHSTGIYPFERLRELVPGSPVVPENR